MKKNILLFVSCLLLLGSAHAQYEFHKTYGGYANDNGTGVIQTPDGNFVIVGFTYSIISAAECIYMLKVAPDGNIIWTKAFGSSTTGGAPCSVRSTMDGGFIIGATGYAIGTMGNDFLLIKT